MGQILCVVADSHSNENEQPDASPNLRLTIC